MAWSPDGRTLASAHDDGTVALWKEGVAEPVRVLSGHQGSVRSVGWSPDGRRIVSGGDDGTIRRWNADSGALELVMTLLPAHEWMTTIPGSLAYASSPHGDEFWGVRFDSQLLPVFPLSLSSFRSRLKRSVLRQEPMLTVQPDLLYLAGEVLKTNRRGVRLGLILYGAAAAGILVAAAFEKWISGRIKQPA